MEGGGGLEAQDRRKEYQGRRWGVVGVKSQRYGHESCGGK